MIAAGLFAVVSPAPYLEGFTGNGELLATAFTTTAVAAAAWWMVGGDRRLLVLAGVAAGIAPLIKQSALDGLVVVALVIAGRPRLRQRSRVTGAVLADDDGRSAAELRALAEAAAARGDWDEALVERFRALVRALDERTILTVSPGTTTPSKLNCPIL